MFQCKKCQVQMYKEYLTDHKCRPDTTKLIKDFFKPPKSQKL